MAASKPAKKVQPKSVVGQPNRKVEQATVKLESLLTGMFANGASQAYVLRIVREVWRDL
jgi:hypothetical protein